MIGLPKERAERMFRLAYERMRIYVYKELGLPKPWTQDTILQRAFFCNVFRHLDKTSAWINNNIITVGERDNYLWASIIVARYISRIDCLQEVYDAGGFDPSYDIYDRLRIIYKTLLNRKHAGLPINTGAFITSPMLGEWGPTKAHYIVRLISELIEADFGNELEYTTATMQNIHKTLMRYRCVGSFMAYQYCCDFSYTRKYLKEDSERTNWSALGPGSLRGVRRIMTGMPSGDVAKMAWLGHVQSIRYEWAQYVYGTIGSVKEDAFAKVQKFESGSVSVADATRFVNDSFSLFHNIRMQDVQHWLCEYDKYERGGSSKRRYDGTAV